MVVMRARFDKYPDVPPGHGQTRRLERRDLPLAPQQPMVNRALALNISAGREHTTGFGKPLSKGLKISGNQSWIAIWIRGKLETGTGFI